MPSIKDLAQLAKDVNNTCATCVYKCVKDVGHVGGTKLPKLFKEAELLGQTPAPVDVLLLLDFPRMYDDATDPLRDVEPDNPVWTMLNLMVKHHFDVPAPFLRLEDPRPITWALTFATKCKPGYYTSRGLVGTVDVKGKKISSGGDKKSNTKALKSCAPLTRDFVLRTRPKVIMCFGKDALTSLGVVCKTERESRGHVYPVTNIKYEDGTSPWAILVYKPGMMCNPKEISAISVWERDFLKTREIVFKGHRRVPVSEMSKDYVYPKTVEEIKAVCEILKKQPWITCDIESSGLNAFSDSAKFKIISFGWGEGKACAFFIDHPSVNYTAKDAMEPVSELFASGVPISGHNFKFDVVYMAGLGYIKPADVNLMWDTLLVEYWLDENRAMEKDEASTNSFGFGELGLKTLVWDYFTRYGGYEESADMKAHFAAGTEPDPADFLLYGAADGDLQWRLTLHQMDRIARSSMRERAAFHNCFYGTLLPSVKTAIEAELFGVRPNTELIKSLKPRVAMELFRLRNKIEQAGKAALKTESFSISSDKDMKQWLFGSKMVGGLELPPTKLTPKGAPSLDQDAVELILEKYSEIVPELSNYSKWAKLSKLSTTYLDQPLNFTGNDGKIHCNIVLHGARTGRISIQDPPLQTLSKELGKLPVVPPEELARLSILYAAGKFEKPEEFLDEIDIPKYEASFLTNRQANTPKCKEEDLDKLAMEKVVPKALYCAPEGYELVGADLSQIEVVVAACKASEYKMLCALDKGLDMHCTVGGKIHGYDYTEFLYWTKGDGSQIPENELTSEQIAMRKRYDADRTSSKTVSFGVLYGMSTYSLKDRLSYTKEEEELEDIELDSSDKFALQPKDKSRLDRADKIFEAFLGEFSKINEYINKCHHEAMKYYQVISEFGRIRRFPVLKYILAEKDWKQVKILRRIVAACKRQAANAPIQGMASDMCLKSKVKIHDTLKKVGGSALFPVHDNILAAAPKGMKDKCFKLFKLAMLEWPRWRYPDVIKCKLSSDFEVSEGVPSAWGNMKKYKG